MIKIFLLIDKFDGKMLSHYIIYGESYYLIFLLIK